MLCYGCGQKLQSSDENMSGYVPAKILNTRDSVLCQRCFKLQHYNTNIEVELIDEDYEKILTNITNKDALIVYVIDIFNFEASVIENLSKYLKNQKLLILVNKRDLIPSAVKDEKIIKWVKKRLTNAGLKITDVILASGMTNYNIDLILDKITDLREGKDVYIIGNANVGKSTFINSLLRNYNNETDHFITTSTFPGTTLNVIKIPLDQKSYIYDTPGLIAKKIIWNVVEPKLLKYILPRKELKPLTFQLKEKQSLLLGGLAAFDFIKGGENNFTCYFSSSVNIVRTKLDKSVATFNSLLKNGNIKPSSIKIKSIDDLVVNKIKITEKHKIDVVINGYGWISFEGKDMEITLHLPKNVGYHIREPLI